MIRAKDRRTGDIELSGGRIVLHVGVMDFGVICRISCGYDDDDLVRPLRQLRIDRLVMDKVASSQAHCDVGEGRVHGVIMVPEIAWGLSVIVSIDFDVI